MSKWQTQLARCPLYHWLGITAARRRVIAALPAARPVSSVAAMVDGAGHYPHAQSPDQVAALVIEFLKDHAGA